MIITKIIETLRITGHISILHKTSFRNNSTQIIFFISFNQNAVVEHKGKEPLGEETRLALESFEGQQGPGFVNLKNEVTSTIQAFTSLKPKLEVQRKLVSEIISTIEVI